MQLHTLKTTDQQRTMKRLQYLLLKRTLKKRTLKKRTVKSSLSWPTWKRLLARTNRWTLQAQNMQKRPTRLKLTLLQATMAMVPHTT